MISRSIAKRDCLKIGYHKISWFIILYWLVVQCAHLGKYEFVNGKDDIPYMKWKIKAMFETTKQYIIFIMVGQTPNTSFHAPKCFGDLLYRIISP